MSWRRQKHFETHHWWEPDSWGTVRDPGYLIQINSVPKEGCSSAKVIKVTVESNSNNIQPEIVDFPPSPAVFLLESGRHVYSPVGMPYWSWRTHEQTKVDRRVRNSLSPVTGHSSQVTGHTIESSVTHRVCGLAGTGWHVQMFDHFLQIACHSLQLGIYILSNLVPIVNHRSVIANV